MRIKIKIKKWKFFFHSPLPNRPEKTLNENWKIDDEKFSFLYAKKASLTFLSERKWGKFSMKITCWHMAIVWRHQFMFSRNIKVYTAVSDDAVKIFPLHSCKQKKSLSFSLRRTMLCNHLQIAHMRLSLICAECY